MNKVQFIEVESIKTYVKEDWYQDVEAELNNTLSSAQSNGWDTYIRRDHISFVKQDKEDLQLDIEGIRVGDIYILERFKASRWEGGYHATKLPISRRNSKLREKENLLLTLIKLQERLAK